MSISEADDHRKVKLTLDVFKSIYQQEQLKLFYKCTPLYQKLLDVNLPNLTLKHLDINHRLVDWLAKLQP